MTKASCESSQEDWCFFDHFLLMLFWTLPFDASLASWLSWHLGSYFGILVSSVLVILPENHLPVRIQSDQNKQHDRKRQQ